MFVKKDNKGSLSDKQERSKRDRQPKSQNIGRPSVIDHTSQTQNSKSVQTSQREFSKSLESHRKYHSAKVSHKKKKKQ